MESEPGSAPKRESLNKQPARIIINRGKVILAKTETDRRFMASPIEVAQDDQDSNRESNINESAALSGIESIKVFIQETGDPIETNLPENILNRLTRYLRNLKDNSEHFDCEKFIHFLYAIKPPDVAHEPLDTSWEYPTPTDKPLPHRNQYTPGTVFGFFKTNNRTSVVHVAMYLGRDTFLSQSGSAGQLVATSFNDTLQMQGVRYWSVLTAKTGLPPWTDNP